MRTARRPVVLVISIHALREEGDEYAEMVTAEHKIFLSTPSARRATDFLTPELLRTLFLSTPSVRRATGLPGLPATRYGYFYPRPP